MIPPTLVRKEDMVFSQGERVESLRAAKNLLIELTEG